MKQHIRILVVEDDASAAMITQIALEDAWSQKGIVVQVRICPDGLSAINYLKSATELPDLILADVKMPKLDGLRLLSILKADHRLRAIPVIMLTTSDDPDDVLRAYDGQCAGYLIKSANFDQFATLMNTLENYWNASELP